MSLFDPRPALAEQSTFVSYLTGVAALGRVVQTLAGENGTGSHQNPSTADDFVHMLLGMVSLGASVEALAEATHGPVDDAQQCGESSTPTSPMDSRRWLR